MAPYMATPTIRLTAVAILNIGSRNSRSGRVGSVTRLSTATNAASSTVVTTPRPTMTPELHAYSAPPQVVTSTNAEIAPDSNAMPVQSMRTWWR